MWEIVDDSILARYFEFENIWQKEWIATDQIAIIKDYWHSGGDRDIALQIWKTDIHGKTKSFAASEVGCMNRWVFALPADEVFNLDRLS